MKRYKSFHMVRMEHLNHHYNLYAGRGIEWMIESAFIAACLEHGNKDGLLYKNTHKFDFIRSVKPGDIVSYESVVVRSGKTSINVHVNLKNADTGELYAEGYVTFVTVDPVTKKSLIHRIMLDDIQDNEEIRWREEADSFFSDK